MSSRPSAYDNALAETINGLYKAEVIHRRGPWRSFEAVEFATLESVDWFNNRRLLEPIGNIPPAEAVRHAGTAGHGGITKTKWPPANPGAVQFVPAEFNSHRLTWLNWRLGRTMMTDRPSTSAPNYSVLTLICRPQALSFRGPGPLSCHQRTFQMISRSTSETICRNCYILLSS